jgi:hypothetical protein
MTYLAVLRGPVSIMAVVIFYVDLCILEVGQNATLYPVDVLFIFLAFII